MHLDSSLNLLWLCDSFRLTEAARLAGRPSRVPRSPSHTPRPDPQPHQGSHVCTDPLSVPPSPQPSPASGGSCNPPAAPGPPPDLASRCHCSLWTHPVCPTGTLPGLPLACPLPPCRLPVPSCTQARTPGPSSPDEGAQGAGELHCQTPKLLPE